MSTKRFLPLFAIIIAGLMAAAGCSSGDGSIPLLPNDTAKEADSGANHMFWGLYQFICKPDAGVIDIIPLRGIDMHLNAIVFLEPPPMVNLTIESLEFIDTTIEVDIGLKHPFLGLTEFSGFDVCGVVISDGSYSGFGDGLTIAGPGDFYLVNTDGHSRWWNPSEFPNDGSMFGYKDGLLGAPDSLAGYNAQLNGYKYFADGLEPDDDVTSIDPALRGLFSAGAKNVRHYTIDMGTAGLIFNYAIDANWQFPSGDFPWKPRTISRPRRTAWNRTMSKSSKHRTRFSTTGQYTAASFRSI